MTEIALSAPPEAASADFVSALTAAELEAFRRDGYLATDRLAPAAELRAIRELYDSLFATDSLLQTGQMFDTLGGEGSGPEAMRLPQMFMPSRQAPWLRATTLHRNCLAIARQILGPRAACVAEFAILKPPGRGAPTPWHQDAAFFRFSTRYDECIALWIGLQEVREEHGCMLYVPGSHRGPLLPHRPAGGNPRAHGLELVDPGAPEARAVTLPAGAAAIHHSNVIHGAGPNLSREARRGYTLVFGVRQPRLRFRRSPPWNRGRWTPRDELELRALPRLSRLRGRLRKVLVRLGL